MPTDLRPTAARIRLMRAIAAGEEVTRHRRSRRGGGEAIEIRWDGKDITRLYGPLAEAGLLMLGPMGRSLFTPRAVQITTTGREWLAEHDEEN